jgi:uncharacterized protein (AIM24 family)
MRDQLFGTTQPLLSISLDPGESIIAEVGEFAWMTDSIAMAPPGGVQQEPRLCAYTATDEPGVVAFASRLPGCILSVDVGQGHAGCLVVESCFLAGTPGVQITEAGPLAPRCPGGRGITLWRIGGSGRAWVGLPGDVVRRELTAGQSLRAHPRYIGMFDATIAIQVARVEGISGHDDAYPCAVLSGPGAVWLGSMPASSAERLGGGRPTREQAVG